MERLKTQIGLTLIELLIVLAVMSLIATIAFPHFVGILDAFKFKSDVETARGMAKVIQLKIASGTISTAADDNIDESEFGEAFPKSKLDDGYWVCSHDGTKIEVRYERHSDGDVDDDEPYVEKNVIAPLE
jgi:prepilin-type N-terminal cleavage/methylation domain-containing protein